MMDLRVAVLLQEALAVQIPEAVVAHTVVLAEAVLLL
jgi:hypothetical protein